VGADRDLVRLYWPPELRPAFDALSSLDDGLANVVAKASQPMLGAIKLAWWRERLEELEPGKAPAEPRLRAVAAELLPRGVSGAALAGLTDGWTTLLEEAPNPERIGSGGAQLFAIAAQLLGSDDPLIGAAGRLYRRADVQRRELTYVEWPTDPRLSAHRFSKALRPLTALAALAARDAARGSPLEPEGTPGRALALIRHRLSGRLPG
jgi:phytoene synthase